MLGLERPSKEILMAVHGISMLLALLAFAAGIAWVYYVGKAVDDNMIGGKKGNGKDGDKVDTDDERNKQRDTVTVMFQGAVASILFYYVFRHHFSSHHY